MAKIAELDPESWDSWVATRPAVIQEMCRRLPPDRLYRMKSTGSRVTLLSYSENGTVTVAVTGQFNAIVFERQVFGIDANDLEECDLPAEGEALGALLTEDDEIEAYVDTIRPLVLAERH